MAFNNQSDYSFAEGRALGKINLGGDTLVATTESREMTATKLKRIAWLSGKDHQAEFKCLMHHINVGSLRGYYQQLDGRKAVGVDGVNKETYDKNLEENLEGLIQRMKRMGSVANKV